jgi:hypothetical protein
MPTPGPFGTPNGRAAWPPPTVPNETLPTPPLPRSRPDFYTLFFPLYSSLFSPAAPHARQRGDAAAIEARLREKRRAASPRHSNQAGHNTSLSCADIVAQGKRVLCVTHQSLIRVSNPGQSHYHNLRSAPSSPICGRAALWCAQIA